MPRDYQYAEGGGPLPPYRESFLENIIAVGWGGLRFYGAYIVSLEDTNGFASVLAVSIDGLKWHLWPVPLDPLGGSPTGRCYLWTISGGPAPNNTFVLQAAGGAEGGKSERAILFHTTNFGKSWYINTPDIYGESYAGSQIDGGGYSFSAASAIATTWAYKPGFGALNSILMLKGGKWQELARAPDPSHGGWEFPAGIIPDDSICYNTAGGGFDEFPPVYWDPIATVCPYVGPDFQSGVYSGGNQAIGPPGALICYDQGDFRLTIFKDNKLVEVPVKQLNDTKLPSRTMFFASNFGFDPPKGPLRS